MKKVIFVLIFCVQVLVTDSFSQSTQESIKELFKVMQQDSIMDKMFNSMVPTLINQLKNPYLMKDSLMISKSNEIFESTMNAIKDITKRMINEDMVEIYGKYFTQSEIKDLISFYKTPSGQKFIKTTPDISKDLMAIMVQKYMPEMQKIIKEKVDGIININEK